MKHNNRPAEGEATSGSHASPPERTSPVHRAAQEVDRLFDAPKWTLVDRQRSLRAFLQARMESNESADETDRIRSMAELLPEDRLKEFRSIIRSTTSCSLKSEEHPVREFIDVERGEIGGRVYAWIGELVRDVEQAQGVRLPEEDRAALEEQCLTYFRSLRDVVNTRSVERDARDFYRERKGELGDGGDAAVHRARAELLGDLRRRSDIPKEQLVALVKLVEQSELSGKPYEVRALVDLVADLTRSYGITKGKLATLSAVHLTSQIASTIAPMSFTWLKGNIPAAFAALLGITNLGAKSLDLLSAKMTQDLQEQITKGMNERIASALFFMEFEQLQGKSSGEFFDAVSRGKEATTKLFTDALPKLIPTAASALTALAMLTYLHKGVGAGALVSAIPMVLVSNHLAERSRQKEEGVRRSGGAATTRLQSAQRGVEELRTLPGTPGIAMEMREVFDRSDRARQSLTFLQKFNEYVRNLTNVLPQFAAAASAAALMKLGVIPGSAQEEVLTGAITLPNFYGQAAALTSFFTDYIPWLYGDIQRMERVLDERAIDRPDSEAELRRKPASAAPGCVLTIRDLSYSAPDGKQILRGLNLQAHPGEFIAIVGESGAGKSTLMKHIVGLLKPDSGEITLGKGEKGDVPTSGIKRFGEDSLYTLLSYSPQEPTIFEDMTLRENLCIGAIHPVDNGEIKGVLRSLGLSSLEEKLGQKPHGLSGGQRVRIGIARALLKGAKIFIFDEPTTGLDSKNAAEMRKILLGLTTVFPDVTVICVTHDEALSESEGIRKIELLPLKQTGPTAPEPAGAKPAATVSQSEQAA